MIDTVILTIPETNYKILEPEKFTPSATILNNPVSFGGRAFTKCTQNSSNEDYENGIYKPYLTITKRAVKGGFIKPLKIQFSAPKLLYRENVTELETGDFFDIVDTLQRRLLDMGVEISTASIHLAQVSTIHFSKNIILPPFITTSMVLKELAKTNLTKRLSLDKTMFKNLGYALTFYSKSYAIVLYDKIKDIQQRTGVKVDKDNTFHQQELFTENKPPSEILRIEIRLNLPCKILSVLKALDETEDRNFIHLFNSKLAQKVVKFYWDIMTQGMNQMLFSLDSRIDATAEEIYKANPKISAQKLLTLLAITCFVKQQGMRPLRQFIESHYSDRTWFRISKDIKKASFSVSTTAQLRYLLEIAKSIDDFKPVKLIDIQPQMINNDKYRS